MRERTRFTSSEALRVGDALGVDWSRLDLETFRRAVEAELDHARDGLESDATNRDPVVTGRIALEHLLANPRHYAVLEKDGA